MCSVHNERCFPACIVLKPFSVLYAGGVSLFYTLLGDNNSQEKILNYSRNSLLDSLEISTGHKSKIFQILSRTHFSFPPVSMRCGVAAKLTLQ